MTYLVGLVALLSLIITLDARILISEIMYAPREYDELFEYIEIFNSGPRAVSLAGWSIPIVKYTIPDTISIESGERRLVVANRLAFNRAYPNAATKVIGSFAKGATEEECNMCLPNKGGEIKLLNKQGEAVFSVEYNNKKEWSPLASGFGSSLELICSTAKDPSKPGYWVASTVPELSDPHEEYGGTPGSPPNWESCYGPELPDLPEKSVGFSEIMYHPIGQTAREELHEFIEIANPTRSEVDLSLWRLVSDSGVRYTFPLGTSIAHNEHIVIVRDKKSFDSVYPGIKTQVLEHYTGELSNGECKVALVDANGFVRDYINYEDSEPWPRAADALGASEKYLPDGHHFKGKRASMKFKGQSLTRRTFEWGSNKPEAWSARTPTPGEPNWDLQRPLLPVVGKVKSNPKKRDIKANQAVTLEFELHPYPLKDAPLSRVVIESYVDDVISDNPPKPNIIQTEAKFNAKKEVFTAELQGRPANTIVRYRVIALFGAAQVVSPGPKEPFQWFSLFWPPESRAGTPSYHMFLRPAQWSNLRVWAERGRMDECSEKPDWGKKIMATLVYSEEGDVLPALVRYQGSMFNRVNGVEVHGFPRAPPGGLKAYSYRVSLPSYGKIEGTRDLIFHKMWQGCTMYQTPMLNKLMEEAGVMGSPVTFARLHLNGLFFRYMMVIWPASSGWLDRWHKIQNRRCIHQSKEGHRGVGELYKVSVGIKGAHGDWSKIGPACGHTEEQRYSSVYSLSTNEDFANTVTLREHIRIVNDEILSGKWNRDQSRKWLEEKVDVNLLLTYTAIINWASTWDQVFHNQVQYRRETDRKWSWHPWDGDNMYHPPNIKQTLYAGENFRNHNLRKAIIVNFREELNNRLRLFQNTIHNKAKILKDVDFLDRQFDQKQAAESYGKFQQNFPACVNDLRTFVNERWDFTNSQLGQFNGDANAELVKIWCPSKPTLTIKHNTYSSPIGPPINLRVVGSTTSSITLEWFPPNVHNRKPTAYLVTRTANKVAGKPSTVKFVNDGKAVRFVDNEVTVGTTYQYSVTLDAERAVRRTRSVVSVTLKQDGSAALSDQMTTYKSTNTQSFDIIAVTVGIVVGAMVVLMLVVIVTIWRAHSNAQEERI